MVLGICRVFNGDITFHSQQEISRVSSHHSEWLFHPVCLPLTPLCRYFVRSIQYLCSILVRYHSMYQLLAIRDVLSAEQERSLVQQPGLPNVWWYSCFCMQIRSSAYVIDS
jgi:hypothetical protein